MLVKSSTGYWFDDQGNFVYPAPQRAKSPETKALAMAALEYMKRAGMADFGSLGSSKEMVSTASVYAEVLDGLGVDPATILPGARLAAMTPSEDGSIRRIPAAADFFAWCKRAQVEMFVTLGIEVRPRAGIIPEVVGVVLPKGSTEDQREKALALYARGLDIHAPALPVRTREEAEAIVSGAMSGKALKVLK